MLVTVAEARANHGIDADYPADPITLKLSAAEQLAQKFINRRVYADQTELDAARAPVPADILAAGVVYEAAIVAADLIEDEVAAAMAVEFAESTYSTALTDAREKFAGLVVNEQIKAAILLIFGHLFENHEDVVMGQAQALPMGSQYLLQPYRVGMGV